MKKRIQHPPAYVDGYFNLFDLVDVQDPDNPDAPIRKIRERSVGDIWFRDLAVYDRTRLVFEQAGKEVTHKLAIPRWDGIDTSCVCMIGNRQYKVYNAAPTETRDGYRETELTLITPEMTYEVIE